MNLPPPAEVKRYLLARTLAETKIRTFVETGTFHGDTIAAVLPYVDKAITIEVDRVLFEAASKRFFDQPKVELHHSDSADRLADLLQVQGAFEIARPALFWLDAHWMGPERRDPMFNPGSAAEPMTYAASGDTPIVPELRAILARNCADDIIVIDDARYFGFVPSYPRVSELAEEVGVTRTYFEGANDFRVDVVLDMIWISRSTFVAPTRGMRYDGSWGCPVFKGMVLP